MANVNRGNDQADGANELVVAAVGKTREETKRAMLQLLLPVLKKRTALTSKEHEVIHLVESRLAAENQAERDVIDDGIHKLLPKYMRQPLASPPDWLHPEAAASIAVDLLLSSESQQRKRELIHWIQTMQVLRGAPRRREDAYREAARLKQDSPHLSWRKIAHKLCPLRLKEPNHKCTRECENRVRLGATRFLPRAS
jgi:hypothetical protein